MRVSLLLQKHLRIVISHTKCMQMWLDFGGAESLAQVLPTYYNIQELWLYDNAITVDGACLIMQSAITNTKCEAVWVDPIYENGGDTEKLMIILNKRVRQGMYNKKAVLMLWHTYIR